MTKVLVLATTFPRWKNDTEPGFVYELSKLLSKNHSIVVLAPHHYKAKKYEKVGNITVYRFPYFFEHYQRLCYDGGIHENIKKSFLAKLQVFILPVFEFFAILRIIKKEKIDFIHAHWIIPNGLLAAVIKILRKKPFIVTAHAGDIFPLHFLPLRLLARFTLRSSSAITVNSMATKKTVLSVANMPTQVIPMGVHISLFSPGKKSSSLKKKLKVSGPMILSVGRLAEKKGLRYLISAMPSIISRFPQTKLVIIGEGPHLDRLKKLVLSLNLPNNVLFLGKIQNKVLPQYYATADVFVLPSIVTKSGDTEGLGVVLLEAMASGTPVVGSNVGGIPDVIKDKVTGLLVPQMSPAALSAAVIKLLNNKKLSSSLVKNAQKHVKEHFAWPVVAKKFEKIYHSML